MSYLLYCRGALRRRCFSLLMAICSACRLPEMSAGSALTLQLTQQDEPPQTVPFLKQLNTSAVDILSPSSEIGEDFALRVVTPPRANHGNKVIRGVNETGGRPTMVVTSYGQLKWYLRKRCHGNHKKTPPNCPCDHLIAGAHSLSKLRR